MQVPSQPKAVLTSIKGIVRCLEKEILRLKKQIREHFKSHDSLKRDAKLLQSIPGVGEITAWDLLAELPDVNQFDSAQAVAAYAGWRPVNIAPAPVFSRTRVCPNKAMPAYAKPFTSLPSTP